ncbi:MAG: di-trans,poly-cis-decaprenylcistransferase [Clostridia bacterium]|nr:di-trans,poly-cis-decaprenylcistransferase [Clostridia bacterium]
MGLFKRCNKEKRAIDMQRLPAHIGFIMDGNGRYAVSRGMPRNYGHKEGVQALKRVIEASFDLGIKVVSFYMFSTENWKRPQQEIDYIFSLAKNFKNEVLGEYVEKGIKVVTMGDLSKLPLDLQDSINELVEETKNNDKMIVNIGLNYGGRSEIIRACNNIIADGHKEVSEELFSEYLYTKNLPDPDIIVRTSGEMRVSNFMLYQLAYSEMIFPKKHWPEFDKGSLEEIIVEFQGRNRRFGGLKA